MVPYFALFLLLRAAQCFSIPTLGICQCPEVRCPACPDCSGKVHVIKVLRRQRKHLNSYDTSRHTTSFLNEGSVTIKYRPRQVNKRQRSLRRPQITHPPQLIENHEFITTTTTTTSTTTTTTTTSTTMLPTTTTTMRTTTHRNEGAGLTSRRSATTPAAIWMHTFTWPSTESHARTIAPQLPPEQVTPSDYDFNVEEEILQQRTSKSSSATSTSSTSTSTTTSTTTTTPETTTITTTTTTSTPMTTTTSSSTTSITIVSSTAAETTSATPTADASMSSTMATPETVLSDADNATVLLTSTSSNSAEQTTTQKVVLTSESVGGIQIAPSGYASSSLFGSQTHTFDPTKCNSDEWMQLLLQDMLPHDATSSKLQISEDLGADALETVSVLCSKTTISFRLVASKYCQMTAGDVTCLIFEP